MALFLFLSKPSFFIKKINVQLNYYTYVQEIYLMGIYNYIL